MNSGKRFNSGAPELGRGVQENNSDIPRQVQQEKKYDDLNPLIQVENLSLRYGTLTALGNITLDIHRGCITALIGPSGCGKTSFLSCINRLTDLIPNCRITGRILIGGSDIHHPGCDVQALRQRIGMVFQKPTPFPLSVRRNIELPLREHGVTRTADIDAIIERVLREVGLWEEVNDRLHVSALSLSGGQQQRLCIARALALNPEILLMDEPCSAASPTSQHFSGPMAMLAIWLNLALTSRFLRHRGMNLPQLTLMGREDDAAGIEMSYLFDSLSFAWKY